MSSSDRGMNQLNRQMARYIEQAIRPKPVEQTGYYLGYDADLGVHQVRLTSGKVITGKMISNGEPKISSLVSVRQGKGQNLFDTMPR